MKDEWNLFLGAIYDLIGIVAQSKKIFHDLLIFSLIAEWHLGGEGKHLKAPIRLFAFASVVDG